MEPPEQLSRFGLARFLSRELWLELPADEDAKPEAPHRRDVRLLPGIILHDPHQVLGGLGDVVLSILLGKIGSGPRDASTRLTGRIRRLANVFAVGALRGLTFRSLFMGSRRSGTLFGHGFYLVEKRKKF